MSNEFPCFAFRSEHLDGRYLQMYFSRGAAWTEALGLSSGGTPTSRNRLKDDKLLAMMIPLPSLAEQRRIVARIEALVARIEALAARIEEARGLRRVAVEVTDGLATSTARERLADIEEEISELRCWVTADEIQTGPFGAQLSSDDFVESGVPVLTIGNVQFGGLHMDSLKRVTEEKASQLSRYAVNEGDILFARMGTVGRCCVVPNAAAGWLINYHIIRVALDRSRVEPRYIHWTIQASADVEAFLDERIRGATREGVNSSIVGALPCRVPSLPEQRQIVAYLDEVQGKVEALKRVQADTGAELEALLPAVLDRAFRGEL